MGRLRGRLIRKNHRITLTLLATSLLLGSCSYTEGKVRESVVQYVEKAIELINDFVVEAAEDVDPKEINIDDRVRGTIVKVFDGDTYDLQINREQTIRIRMEGIDAPEVGMPYYRVSKNHLSEMADSRSAEVLIMDIDQYGRYVAYTFLDDGRELSKEMIRAGMAWHYFNYNQEEELIELEKWARENKVGLWRESPYVIEPWKVRRLRRQGYKTDMIYKAQREHIRNQHIGGCHDKHLCDIIFGD